MNKFWSAIQKVKYPLSLGILFVVAAFLRLYRFQGFATFLADQGRDAIIIKRIVTGEHFPAIGASMSIGQVFLGPFYYYFIAPWLFFFQMDPIGLAFGVCIFSLVYILVNFYIVSDLFDKKIALISTVFLTFSSVLIDFSRFSWNPNLLPLFSLLTIYFFIKGIKKMRLLFFFLSGMFLSFSIQLHYLALLLGLPMFLIVIYWLIKTKNKSEFIKCVGVMGISFLLFSSPLIIFDIRHQFINIKNFGHIFSDTTGEANKIINMISTWRFLNYFALGIDTLIINVGVLIISIFILFKTKLNEYTRFIIFFFVILFLGLCLYSGPKYVHYYAFLFPLYFILLSLCLSKLTKHVSGVIAIGIVLIAFIYVNGTHYSFLFQNPNNQIANARTISKAVYKEITAKNYTITSLPQNYADSMYRYFLEAWGKPPAEKDSIRRNDELFVVCEGPCKPIGDKQWDIAYFAPNKVIGKWDVNNVTIYKLIR